MATTDLYNPALLEHVSHPDYNYALDDATHVHEGINPSCGDDLTLHIRVGADGLIDEASWTGTGCAVSKASADMMSDLVTGETPERARELCHLFGRMIRGEEKDAEVLEEELDEAACLSSVSHMPARVKCAELAWRTLDEMLAGSATPSTTEDGE
jgi:nitrogen fixation NifU-like protein